MLFKALAVFAMRDINLTKVCSFCSEFLFFEDMRVRTALLTAFVVISFQIESRPLQKQALRAVDESNNGFPK